MRNAVKKLPHNSNSSNFSASFLVNEYYNASVKGIKNLMDFYNFFALVHGLRTVAGVGQGLSRERKQLHGVSNDMLALRCWIEGFFPQLVYIFFPPKFLLIMPKRQQPPLQ
jgi:hypothetical protein